jgi:hypothetical protein
MDLTSGLPFWTVRNGLLQVYPPLDSDIRCDALIISGALLAHRLTIRPERKGVVYITRRSRNDSAGKP